MGDEPLLVLKGLEQVGIEGPFGDVVVDLHFFVPVALADNTAIALGHIRGLPAHIQVVDCHQPVLYVGACSHLLGAAQQNPDLACTDLGEQFLLLGLGVCGVDEGHFALGYPRRQQLLFDVIIDVELPISFGGGQIAEQELGQLLVLSFFPDLQDIADAGVQLAVRVIRQQRVHQPLVQADLPSVVGDAKHIVLCSIHRTAVNGGSPLG